MSGRTFKGLFESLEASFEAAGAHADRQAAGDLALSLLQDRSTAEILGRGGWGLVGRDRIGGPITAVGRDYAVVGADLVPLRGLVARRTASADAPEVRRDSLRERLRGWARQGRRVDMSTGEERVAGRLLAAGRDHLIVGTTGGETLVPYGVVDRITPLRGSSADAL